MTERPAGAEIPAYRRDIDGLRAVAVLAVLAYHAFPALLPGGFVGVDVFFVISGFLITGILLGNLERGTFSLRGFYARRVRRIFPALIVVLAACWVFGWFSLFPDEYRQLGRHLVGGAAFVSNFYFWGEAGYFDNAADTKPLLHLWSLGIEEQFYIVWPLLVWATSRTKAGILRWMPALALVSFVVNVGWVASHPTATFYSPASRVWELALGGILAGLAARGLGFVGWVRRQNRPAEAASQKLDIGSRRRNLQAAAGAAMIVFALALANEYRDFPGWWALAPTLGTALILQAGPSAWINRVLLANRPMVWIGLISYPLYLWHWPLLSFARIVESETPALSIRIAGLAAAFVLAIATYWLVEKPFRSGPHARWKVVTLAVAMAVIYATGRITASRDGLPRREAVQIQQDHQRALLVPDDAERGEKCKRRYGLESYYQFCLLDRLEDPPTVALIGDSHARHLVAGLTSYYRGIGENLLFLGTRLPFWDVAQADAGGDGARYQAVTNGMLDISLRETNVHTVILATKLKFDSTQKSTRRYIAAARATIRRFLDAGKHVILVRDVPSLDFEPRQCIRRAAIPSSKTRVPCAVPRAAFDSATAESDRVLDSFRDQFPTIEIFDAPRYLCDETLCWAILDDQLLYRDRDHLSNDGDLYLGRKFGEERAARSTR